MMPEVIFIPSLGILKKTAIRSPFFLVNPLLYK
jgi:hypothetical protein